MTDRERCRAVGIGDDVGFATKPDTGLRMLRRAVEPGIPFGRVTADEVYGRTSRLRVGLEEHDILMSRAPEIAGGQDLGILRPGPRSLAGQRAPR
ncbi:MULTISPECIES: transposase [Streptomyces]|uniref:Transposase n=1 Tax=Streptomyces flavovirens TaxID=52258 RepID=A0ABV8MZV5_9ACTN|nr:hypothetical protein [Streptomyces sp.]